jgi:predicted MFS family arabinose efflux permease
VLRHLRSPEAAYSRLLRRQRYPSFFLTVVLSRISGAMFMVTGVLLVLERTGSAAVAGVTAAAAVIPGALSGPVLGAWLDVVRRPRALIVFDHLFGASSLVLFVLLAGHSPNWTLPLVAVLFSITGPFSIGGFYSAMSEIAGAELVEPAGSLDATSLNLAVVLGPALAGALTGALGVAPTIEVQVAMTVVAAALIATNPAFSARPGRDADDFRGVVRKGLGALGRNPVLRASSGCSCLASFGWGLMVVGFPLYAVQTLHGRAHDGGYVWAALGVGSILGTFAFAGQAGLRRIGLSYGVLGLSALLWPLGANVLAGVLLVGLTGLLEGPAFSGTIVLRQRHSPPGARAQVVTTIVGLVQIAMSAGAALGGAIHDPMTLIDIFVVVNLLAAGGAWLASRAELPSAHGP